LAGASAGTANLKGYDMSSDVTLSAGVRANLLSLQNTAQLMQTTQNRLATGKRVNSALDNPLNFFTSASLGARANDLSGLLDSMSNGIQTIQAANNGVTAITSLVQQLQATVLQARSDATLGTVTPGTATTLSTAANNSNATNNTMTFHVANGVQVNINVDPGTTSATLTGASTGPITTGNGSINISSADLNGGAPVAVALTNGDTMAQAVTKINLALQAADPTTHVTASLDATNHLVLTNTSGNNITVADAAGNANGTTAALGLTNGASSTDGVVGAPLTVDQMVTAINSHASLASQVKATKTAGGFLSLQNLTGTGIQVDGITAAAVTGVATDSLTLAAGTGGGLSTVRQTLLNQFNSLRTQIDKATGDASYNGINLLNGDTLRLYFNENATSSIDVQTKDAAGNSIAINCTSLGIDASTANVFADNSQLDTLSSNLTTALTTLRTQASALGSSLSVVQTRQDFTKAMINTLQSGADNLILADTNEEGANLLALQTRQSLSTTALSLSAQADQAVLSLFQ
jgi:flagellin-like hook-associated protein FlgL